MSVAESLRAETRDFAHGEPADPVPETIVRAVPVESVPAKTRDLVAGEQSDRVFETIVRAVGARVANGDELHIRRIVREELLGLQGSRVTTFIPILVERAAVARLDRRGSKSDGART